MHPDFTTPATNQVDQFWRNCVTRIQSVIPNRSREPRQNIRPPIPSMSKFKPMPEQWTPLPHNSNGRQSCPDMEGGGNYQTNTTSPVVSVLHGKGFLETASKGVQGRRDFRDCLIRCITVFCYALFICYPAPP